jgi:hypothetical protein
LAVWPPCTNSSSGGPDDTITDRQTDRQTDRHTLGRSGQVMSVHSECGRSREGKRGGAEQN